MIITTFIVSLYMLLVFVVGQNGSATYVKLILIGVTLLSIIGQLARGRSKGKSFSEALVDDEMDGLSELVSDVMSGAAQKLRGEQE